jgi:hypothetical protein
VFSVINLKILQMTRLPKLQKFTSQQIIDCNYEIPVAQRLIISLYDYTGEWAKPYVDAGYPVILWDLKCEGDIIGNWGTLFSDIENAIEAGYYPYGVLAAPPCTDFAVSGAKHFAKKDASIERCGHKDIADNTVDLHVMLVDCVQMLIDYVKQLTGYEFKFWVLENPVGRLETLMPHMKQFRKLLFNPCDFGDPYTKKTILWGEFDTDLKKTPVEPEFIIWAGKKFPKLFAGTGGKSEKSKAKRSTTPAGFAKAFFEANR